MKKLLIVLMFTTSIFANVDIKSLDMYKNLTFVKQKLDFKKNTQKLLGQVKIEDIRFLKEDNCSIGEYTLMNEKENDELSKLISEAKDKIVYKENRIKALKSNIAFLEKTSLTSVSNSKMFQESSNFLKKEILESYNNIYEIEGYIKEDKKELEELLKKRTNENTTYLNYDLKCDKDVFVYYPLNNIKKDGLYDINYNSNKKELEIKNSYFITQSTGVDFKNININLYSFSYVDTVQPRKFYPQYLDLDMPVALSSSKVMIKKAKVERFNDMASAPRYEYNEDTTRSYFTALNVDLQSGKKQQVLFSNEKYKANNSIEIDGYASSKAFYKVDFKSDKLYGFINSRLYLNDSYIGKINIDGIKKDEDNSLYFSNNRFIDVKKELIKDMKEEPFFSLNRLKTQKIWKYEIKNNSNKEEFVSLIERVPVSKHEDIKIELIGSTKVTKFEKNGKITFDFNLKPNETKTIEFGYEILKPNKN